MERRIGFLAPVVVALAVVLPGCESTPSSSGGGGGGATTATIRIGMANMLGPKMGTVSIAAIDGVATTNPTGPFEVQPGVHKITVKCDKQEDVKEIDFAAGDVYEAGIVPKDNNKSCHADLEQTRRGKRKD
jgi:hypothetical protein